MKTRTFTVLFIEEYEEGNGVEMTDEEATKELRDSIQYNFDHGTMMGSNFLIIKVEDGNGKFWQLWEKPRMEEK